MKVAIVGSRGMLGRDLARLCREQGHEVREGDLPELDIATDACRFDAFAGCEALVNCAAYTDVDGAEAHREAAFAVNADGAGRVARWCAERDILCLHLSTDYIFDGRAAEPYREDDEPHPLNVYGESKLAGERAVLAAGGRSLIVRTQSLFGLHGRSFVAAILQRLASDPRAELRVVDDQVSSPTYTGDLAAAILGLMVLGRHGIVHVSAGGSCSWHAFACAIVALAAPGATVRPVRSAEFPRPARRPAFSVLDKRRYEAWTGRRMPDWREGLQAYWRERARGGDARPGGPAGKGP